MTISADADWSRRAVIAAAGGGAMLPSPNSIASMTAGPGLVRAARSIAAFGARPDAPGDINLRALRACIEACREDGAPVLVPIGQFNLANAERPIVLDLTRMTRGALRAVPLIGEGGPAHSLLHVEGQRGGIQLQGASDWFDLIVEGVGVSGAMADALVSIGRNDFTDPVNMARLRDVAVENSFDRGSVVALRLNYIAPGSLAMGLKVNAYADGHGRNYGTALECRQVENMSFIAGAASNASIGVAVRDGVNFGILLEAFTFENTDIGFSNEVSTSGAHTITGCQFSEIGMRAIRSKGCNQSQWIEFAACNFAMEPKKILDPIACEGIWIHDRHGIETPTIPPSAASLRNSTGRSVRVLIWGGAVKALIIDGVRMGGGQEIALPIGTSVTLQPGSTIAMEYSQKPVWQWQNIS